MLEIHGDTELSNMESFNLKETKNYTNMLFPIQAMEINIGYFFFTLKS